MRTEERRILLVSSSRVHGSGYLEHCGDTVAAHFAGSGGLAFAPYALADHDGYAATVRARFAEWDLPVVSLHETDDPRDAMAEVGGLFIGGGNTFRLLKTLYELELLDVIRERVESGMPYLGTSAGSNVAGPTIRTTNDMPIVQPPSFDALGLVGFQINPHYLDPDPGSTHQGETRDQRLREFHEENETAVLALREGSWVGISGNSVTLAGKPGAKLFRRDRPPEECRAGMALDEIDWNS